jgi:hypothetical protein
MRDPQLTPEGFVDAEWAAAKLWGEHMAPDRVARLPAHDVDLLRLILAELRGLRADLRKRDAAPDLVAAIADYFGEGRFTTRGLLELADDEPHRAIAAALAGLVDMNAAPQARATAVGALLARLAEVELVARGPGGVAIYRLR